VNFVENNETPKVPEREHRVVELREVARIFQIEAPNRPFPALRQHSSEGRFANLASAHDCHDREVLEQAPKLAEVFFTRDHVIYHNMKSRDNLSIFHGLDSDGRASLLQRVVNSYALKGFVGLWAPKERKWKKNRFEIFAGQRN